MQIGDKVIVTYADSTQKVGRITGETEKQWRILFDGEENEKRIGKTMKIEMIDDPTTPFPEVISFDTRSLIGKIKDFFINLFTKKKKRS